MAEKGKKCPFSWIQITKSGCFGGSSMVWEPQQCMESNCKLWDEQTNNCGLLTKK